MITEKPDDHIEQSFILHSPNDFSLRKVWLSFTELFVHWIYSESIKYDIVIDV